MTVIDTRLQSAWSTALADLRVTAAEVDNIVATNLVEIARNPNDSMDAARSLVRRMEAQLAATAPTPAAPRSSRGVSARSGRVAAPVESPERRVARLQLESAQRLLTAVATEATRAQTLLRETMGLIRAKAAELVIDGDDETEILRLLNSVPEHMRPALADTIRRDSSLHADLSWGIDGDNNTAFDSYMDRYSPAR